MFTKKRALVCAIILYALGTAALLTYLLGCVVFQALPIKLNTGLPILFIIAYLTAMAMTAVYLNLKKKERSAQINKKPEIDEKEFLKWLESFEPYARLAKKLTKTGSRRFCKVGGMPQVPKSFEWAFRGGVPLPFLMQIDFAEINAGGEIENFPTSGLLYLFVDSEDVNDPDFEDGQDPYEEGKTFKILFYENDGNLKTAQKPKLLETVYTEFYLDAETVKTYPDLDDCKEAFDIYCNRPEGGFDDGYDDLQNENLETTLLGGWATYIQGGGFLESCKESDDDEWVLLLQIESFYDDTDLMLWGDGGTLYLYIRKSDLIAKNFNNVKFDMQCF